MLSLEEPSLLGRGEGGWTVVMTLCVIIFTFFCVSHFTFICHVLDMKKKQVVIMNHNVLTLRYRAGVYTRSCPGPQKQGGGERDCNSAASWGIRWHLSMLPNKEGMVSRWCTSLKGEGLKGGNDSHVHSSRLTLFPIWRRMSAGRLQDPVRRERTSFRGEESMY